MATITVDQQKLVMNAFAAVFQNNLVSKDIVTWKQYDAEMDDRNGLKVSEQIGPRYAITTTSSGVADLSSGVQDSVFGSEQFVVNKTFGASMGWGDFVKIRDIGSARESEALMNAATNLAETIDAYVVRVAALASNNWVGSPANNVATYADMATAYTRLKKEGVEDNDLRAVLSYDDRQALGTTVVAYAATDSLSTQTFRKGFTGEVDGIPTMFTQQLPSLTVGSRVATGVTVIAGANQNVNYKDVAVSGAPGQYMTQVLNLTLASGTTTLKAGDVFTIANVYAYDNRKQAVLPHLQQFTAVADAAAVAGAMAVRVFPAIIVPATGSGGDVNVNTAHATVGTIPADTAAVIHIGVASTAYTPRMILQKQAIIVNTADLILPATGIGSRKQLTQVPLSVRMWQDSTFATGAHQVRFDVALTANVRERRRICRLNGA